MGVLDSHLVMMVMVAVAAVAVEVILGPAVSSFSVCLHSLAS